VFVVLLIVGLGVDSRFGVLVWDFCGFVEMVCLVVFSVWYWCGFDGGLDSGICDVCLWVVGYCGVCVLVYVYDLRFSGFASCVYFVNSVA